MVLSLFAALAFAGSTSLKHVSAGDVPDAQSMGARSVGKFVRATVVHRLWLAGIGCDVVGVVLQVLALHLGALSVVQPLLLTSLLFALVIRGRFEHHHVSRRQAGWALILTAALGAFVVLTATQAVVGTERADSLRAAIVAAVGAVLVLVCLLVGRRGDNARRRAAILGIAVGTIYAGTAALIKAAGDIAAQHPVQLLLSWQFYGVIVLGAAGLLLSQLTFQAGPLTASLPATATVDPLLSIVIGVVVYGEQISERPLTDVLLVVLLGVLVIAVVQLSKTRILP